MAVDISEAALRAHPDISDATVRAYIQHRAELAGQSPDLSWGACAGAVAFVVLLWLCGVLGGLLG